MFLPIEVCVAKLIPANAESIMFALLQGIGTFGYLVNGKLLASMWNDIFDVTDTDYTKLWCLVTIQLVFAFLPLALLWLLPSKVEILQTQ